MFTTTYRKKNCVLNQGAKIGSDLFKTMKWNEISPDMRNKPRSHEATKPRSHETTKLARTFSVKRASEEIPSIGKKKLMTYLTFRPLKVDEVKLWRRKPLDRKIKCYLLPTSTAQRLCNRLVSPVSTSGFSWKVYRNCAFCLSTENIKVMTKNDVDLNHWFANNRWLTKIVHV